MIKYIVLALALLFTSCEPVMASSIYSLYDTYDNAPRGASKTHHTSKGRYHTTRRVVHTAYRPHTMRQRPSYSDGRPRAWCGWYMRQKLGVKNPTYNLAAAWARYGSSSQPGIGVVVVWPHHVGIIVNHDQRGWLVESGNYGNRVATVPLNRMPRNVIAYRS